MASTPPSNSTPTSEPTPHKTTFASNVLTYQAALTSLFTGPPSTTSADLSLLFTPTFTQRDDDTTRDFAAFVAHIAWLRGILPPGGANVVCTQFLRDGNQLAERHGGRVVGADGTVGGTETFLFAEVAEDGRLAWIVESVKRFG